MNNSPQLIPIHSSKAGSCLTQGDWQALGLTTAAYYLMDLLMKPSMNTLENCRDLAAYSGWEGKIILNAFMPPLHQSLYTFRSRYDGQMISLKPETLYALIEKWKAYEVVFVENRGLPAVFFDRKTSFEDFLNQINDLENPVYLMGDFDWVQIKTLLRKTAHWIETDTPAKDALLGNIYSEQGLMAIRSQDLRKDTRVLVEDCKCRTCQQSLTRAYLHHLFDQTPLLCHRFLIEHNFWWIRHS